MAFWKPGTIAPGSEVLAPSKNSSQLDRENEKDASTETTNFVYNPNKKYSLQQQRIRLPIFQNREQILFLVEKYQVVIIVGETGCGKTTQIPQYLYETGWASSKVIGCTQPRRVAATSVASRVAEEMGTQIGGLVGYSIRFDDKSSIETRIKYLTDGMLLREMMLDPLLSKYSVIMIDEAHERSLYSDIILGLLKKIIKKRKDLRLIVSSATIDAEIVRDFFNINFSGDPSLDNVYIMSISGRTFPVDIHYSMKPVADYLEGCLETVLSIHQYQEPGDILVFLTGQEEIETLVTMLKEKSNDPKYRNVLKLKVLPMYAGLPFDKQLQVFEPTPSRTRKVVVATNIAETSITIDGIVYVVDCGFVKIRTYNPKLGIETLVVTPISQATAKQRAGRAGRNRPGKSYRLYSEEAYDKLSPNQIPEIQRSNLQTVVLQLKALGIDNIVYFDFISPPPAENMIRALEILYSLGALDDDCKLTDPVGVTMAEFPVDPPLAKILISSGLEYQCSEEILSIASVLSVQQIFSFSSNNKNAELARRRYAVYEGDHLTLLNVFNTFLLKKKDGNWCKENYFNYRALMRACEIRNQLKKYLKRFKIPIISCNGDEKKILKCLVSGYFANAARVTPDGSYITVRGGQNVHIHPNSIMHNRASEWIIFHEVVQTTKIFLREVSAIEPQWLSEIAPHFYTHKGLS